MLRKIAISVICIITVIVTGHITHIASFYRIQSNDMLPFYQQDDWVLVSNLKHFTYNNIICYKASFLPGSPITFHRIAGLAGDTIEINDGRLLRNHFVADNPKNLMFTYYLKKEQIKALPDMSSLMVKPLTKDNRIIFTLSYNEAQSLSYDYKLRRNNAWNDRCYGPVVVPQGYCFVLGDNRDEAADSRQMGFIPVKDIVGVVTGNKNK
ncbi:MAG: signal peptidase I [Bacteroidota bacterium]|nr:signal peptidase I [Bacteroidota bacterium]